VDGLARRDLALDGVEEADELLMPVALHASPDDLAFQHVEGGEQGGRAVALVVVRHGPGAALLQGEPRLGAVQRLNLGLLVNAEHDRVGRRIDIQTDDVAHFSANFGSFESLKVRMRCGARPWARQMRCTEVRLIPTALAISRPVQWVVSPGGSPRVSATTRSATASPSGGVPGGRVLSRSKPSTPSAMTQAV